MVHFCFKAVIASRRYHVYKETTWSDAKVGDEVKVELETNPNSTAIDPYACAIKTKHKYFVGWKTVGHVPREISRYVYFFIKQEGGAVNGFLKSLQYKPSPIPSAGLEVPLLLKFSCSEEWVCDALKEFVETFYSYDFTGHIVDDDKSDEESDIEVDLAIENSGETSYSVVDTTQADGEEVSKKLLEEDIVID